MVRRMAARSCASTRRHPGRALPGAWHVAGGVEQPAGVLVAAVCLVEDLEKVACRLLRSCAARILDRGLDLLFRPCAWWGMAGCPGGSEDLVPADALAVRPGCADVPR